MTNTNDTNKDKTMNDYDEDRDREVMIGIKLIAGCVAGILLVIAIALL